METAKAYKNYVTSMQNYQISNGHQSYQKPFVNDFELIYKKVQNDDINLNNANEDLNSLSKKELITLQKYNGLAKSIEIGEGEIHPIVPKSMPTDVREAYIDGLNALDEKDRFVVMALTFDIGLINSRIDGSSYTPAVIDYNYLSKRVNDMLNPSGMGVTSEETKNGVRKFWEAFTSSYMGEVPDDKDTTSIDNFIKELREKGASGFLADLNMKKIEKEIEEFRKKLISELGDSPEALKNIEKIVADFKKQLLEELQSSLDSNQDSKKLDFQSSVQTLLKMKDYTTYSPLENLLQEV